jgi:hypothetical protein
VPDGWTKGEGVNPQDGPGPVDVIITIFSPLIVAVLIMIFILGWWVQAAWVRLAGDE